MSIWPASNRQRLALGLIVILLSLGGWSAWKVAAAVDPLGKGDFIAYWSGAYLMRAGRNPYALTEMQAVQQQQVSVPPDFIVMAWNPPSLFIFLWPLAGLSFNSAKAAWLVFNLAALCACSLLLARLYLPPGGWPALSLVLFAVLFPQALVAITMGQITFLVLLGLVGCLALARQRRWFWAGACLVLTTVKPHMAILAVPYLLLWLSAPGRRRAWLGLAAASLAILVSLFLLRPTWIQDFQGVFQVVDGSWVTPTLGGLLLLAAPWPAVRYLIVLCLPLAWWLARAPERVSVLTGVAVLTLVTVPTTFFGWSYDQSLLLIPIAQVFGWWWRQPWNAAKMGLPAGVLAALALNWAQRLTGVNELYYIWIPVFWAVVYGWYAAAQRNAGVSPA